MAPWTDFAGRNPGVPRLIQNLALESLLCAMRQDKKTIDQEAVQHAVLELEAI